MRVETGDSVLIGGFIVSGDHPKRVLLRAIGPSLGMTDQLADPTLELRDSRGEMVASNDNWSDAANAQEIIDAGIPPSDNREAAILTTLDPASYTTIVRGADGGTGAGTGFADPVVSRRQS